MSRVAHARHLAARFFGSLSPAPPPPADEAWAESRLLAGEVAVWRRLSNPDRRHAIGVARRVQAMLGDDATRPVLAAALLHDCGKVASGYGTLRRVGATLAAAVVGRERLAARPGRLGTYLRHDEVGAALLRAAGSDPLTVAWAGEHHLPPARWTVPPVAAAALKAADDD